jgi:hypothetical protein
MPEKEISFFQLEHYEARLKKQTRVFLQPLPGMEGLMTAALMTRTLIEEILARAPAGDPGEKCVWQSWRCGNRLTLHSEELSLRAALSGTQVLWLQVSLTTGIMWHIDFDCAGHDLSHPSPADFPAVQVRISRDLKVSTDCSFDFDGTCCSSAGNRHELQEAMKVMLEGMKSIEFPDDYRWLLLKH